MRKLRLDLDRLHVDSFPTSGSEEVRGTVAGAQESFYCTNTTCPDVTVNPAYTPCGLATDYGCTSH